MGSIENSILPIYTISSPSRNRISTNAGNGEELLSRLSRRARLNLDDLNIQPRVGRYPVGYLDVFFKLLHKICVTPYDFETGVMKKGRLRKLSQMIWSASSTVISLMEIKDSCLKATWAASGNEIKIYVDIINDISRAIFRLIFLHRVRNKNCLNEIKETLSILKHANRNIKKAAKHPKLIAGGLFVFGVSLAFAEFLLPLLQEESLSDFLDINARFFKSAVHAWSFAKREDIFNNEEKISELDKFLGLIHGLLRIAGNIFGQLGFVLVITTVLTLYLPVISEFEFDEDATSYSSVREAKAFFEQLKPLSDSLNESFETQTRSYLVTNLFQSVGLINGLFVANQNPYVRAIQIITLSMCFGTLYMAYSISNKIGKYRSWSKKKNRRSAYPRARLDLILEDLSPDSVGIGTGAACINETFLVGYFGLIATYYLGIVETRSQPK